jgi:ribosomal protein L10
MEEDQFYDNMQKALENLPENYSILEERIEIEIQMKYFELAKRIRKLEVSIELYENKEDLFSEEIDEERKKEILVAIANKDDVKVYRTIEKFVKESEGEVNLWAILALQESKMLLQSSLLDEQQVFISTGLGGKGKKLRYYVVFINENRRALLTERQQKLVKDELIYEVKANEGEFESMDFMDGFSTSLVMLPLQTDIKKVFQNVVDECNQYGNFLNEDMIVTNVKVMSRSEIIQLLHQNKKDSLDELENE